MKAVTDHHCNVPSEEHHSETRMSSWKMCSNRLHLLPGRQGIEGNEAANPTAGRAIQDHVLVEIVLVGIGAVSTPVEQECVA